MQVFQVQSYFKAAAITNAAMAMAYLSTPYQSPNPTKYRLLWCLLLPVLAVDYIFAEKNYNAIWRSFLTSHTCFIALSRKMQLRKQGKSFGAMA